MKIKVGKIQEFLLGMANKEHMIGREVGLCKYIEWLFDGVIALAFLVFVSCLLASPLLIILTFIAGPLYLHLIPVSEFFVEILNLGVCFTISGIAVTLFFGVVAYINQKTTGFYFFPEYIRNKFGMDKEEKESKPSVVKEYLKALKTKVCPIVRLEK